MVESVLGGFGSAGGFGSTGGFVVTGLTVPGSGGLGASTMPLTGGVVLGVGIESMGTESVTGSVDAVGEVFDGLPLTLFAGRGMLGGTEPGFVVSGRSWMGGRLV